MGGEEVADTPPQRHEGAVGPGRVLESLLAGGGEVATTLVCGDGFFNEQPDEAHEAVRAWLEEVRPDLVLAGPAFAAGRYGVACSHVCRIAGEQAIQPLFEIRKALVDGDAVALLAGEEGDVGDVREGVVADKMIPTRHLLVESFEMLSQFLLRRFYFASVRDIAARCLEPGVAEVDPDPRPRSQA